ncbi:hypothetical protein A3K72_00035 [Candidatus Woesearchaeota archaeon RBG_13_36_6]|nr:MAG: hypothetical protein A3K72_00035 [Candidatus Woesearchaeota archaeon RBG_13_36_6]
MPIKETKERIIKKIREKYGHDLDKWINYIREQRNLGFLKREHIWMNDPRFIECIYEIVPPDIFNKWLVKFQTWKHMEDYPLEKYLKLLEKIDKSIAMSIEPGDYVTYTNLPKTITVFRGCPKGHFMSTAWSKDKNIATAMGRRYLCEEEDVIYVYSAQINKEDVFFYTDCRGEEEIVLNPYKLKNCNIIKKVKFNPDPRFSF